MFCVLSLFIRLLRSLLQHCHQLAFSVQSHNIITATDMLRIDEYVWHSSLASHRFQLILNLLTGSLKIVVDIIHLIQFIDAIASNQLGVAHLILDHLLKQILCVSAVWAISLTKHQHCVFVNSLLYFLLQTHN